MLEADNDNDNDFDKVPDNVIQSIYRYHYNFRLY